MAWSDDFGRAQVPNAILFMHLAVFSSLDGYYVLYICSNVRTVTPAIIASLPTSLPAFHPAKPHLSPDLPRQ